MIFHYYLRLPVLLLRNNSKRIIVIRPVLYVYMNNLYTYTCKIVQLMFFQKDSAPTILSSEGETSEAGTPLITSMHSSVIAILTLMISLYLFDSSILLNACHLLSLSLFSS